METIFVAYKGNNLLFFHTTIGKYSDSIEMLEVRKKSEAISVTPRFQLDPGVQEFVLNLVGAGGVVALLKIVKDWVQGIGKSVTIKNGDVEVSIKGKISKHEEELIKELIYKRQINSKEDSDQRLIFLVERNHDE